MGLYIGALGLNKFDDEIEDASNTLSASITVNINDTSNYVLVTSNILVTRITDEMKYRLDTPYMKCRGYPYMK